MAFTKSLTDFLTCLPNVPKNNVFYHRKHKFEDNFNSVDVGRDP